MAKHPGGRPKTRRGDEVSISIEFSRQEFAQLEGYVAVLRKAALATGRPLAEASKRQVVRVLWQTKWRELPASQKRQARATAEYRRLRVEG